MHFQLNAEQRMWQETVRDFCQNELKTRAAQTDAEGLLPLDVVKKMAGLGLLSLASLPADLGEQEPLSKVVRLQIDLWDKPVFFILLVVFAGAEWYLRRRDNLV